MPKKLGRDPREVTYENIDKISVYSNEKNEYRI
jgi:hypothetical protein